jgi:hypothetical protein
VGEKAIKALLAPDDRDLRSHSLVATQSLELHCPASQ